MCARVALQTQGLGTALKILFSEKEIRNLPEHSPSKGFQLTRQEIVALLNGFSRCVRSPLSRQPAGQRGVEVTLGSL